MEIDDKHLAERVDDFVRAALSGEEIVITRAGEPLVKLAPSTPGNRRFRLGILGSAMAAPHLLESIPEADQQAWEGDVDEGDRGDFRDQILRRVEVLLGNRQDAEGWMQQSTMHLNGQVPDDLVKTPEGRAMLDDYLGRLENGVYS